MELLLTPCAAFPAAAVWFAVGMMVITLVAWFEDPSSMPHGVAAWPALQMAPWDMLDFAGFMAEARQCWMVTLVMLFVAIFDTAGVQYMCGVGAGLMDEQDRLPGARAAFFSAGAGTSFGAMFGTSSVIIHNESFAGITDGARTGLHSVVVALLFLVTLPFVPILRAVPPIATAAPLIIVGQDTRMRQSTVRRWPCSHSACVPCMLLLCVRHVHDVGCKVHSVGQNP